MRMTLELHIQNLPHAVTVI